VVNPYAFVVGCPRSGTTLLQRFVDAHPEIAMLDEALWMPSHSERRKLLTPDGRVTPALVARLLARRQFDRMGIGRDEVHALVGAEGGMRYADLVTALYDRYAKTRGKPLVADKIPRYVRRIRTLHALWPTARFIHLIRDGRDVALSFMSWPKAEAIARPWPTWQEDKVTTTALWWERSVRLGREQGAALGGDHYRELRYETLLASPARECEALCAFLELPYASAMLRFYEGKTKRGRGLSSKKAWLPPTPGLRDWRTQMAPAALERFEAAAGDLLDELGYERAVVRPSRTTREGVAAIRRSWLEVLRAGGKRVPAAWAEQR
jgi:hypothetical protein